MKRVNGNTKAIVQVKQDEGKNAIGEKITSWTDTLELTGWLDLSSGDSSLDTFNAKIIQSSHIFICDYNGDLAVQGITAESARMVINGEIYQVKYIDNPMELNYHYEFYLDYVGAQK